MMKLKVDEKNIFLFNKLLKLGKKKDDNTVVISTPFKITIEGIMKDDNIVEIQITAATKPGEKFVQDMLDNLSFVTAKDIEKTGLTLDNLKTAEYDMVYYDRTEFLRRKDLITKLAPGVEFNKALTEGFIYDEITMSFNPKINKVFGDEKDTEIQTEWDKDKRMVYLPINDTSADKNVVDTKNNIIGKYYRNRNTIVLMVNPFKNTDEVVNAIITGLSAFEVKKEDTEKFKMINLAKTFTKDISVRLADKEKRKTNMEKEVKDYQQAIMDKFTTIQMDSEEIIALKNMKDNFKESFFKELKATKELQFIKDVGFTPTEVLLTYKPTCITEPNFIRTSKEYGKRSMYVGEVIIKVGAGQIKIGNTLDLEIYKTQNDPSSGVAYKFPHPHAHDNGECCLGKEATKDTIYMLKSQLKFSDLAIYLCMFVRNFGTDGGFMGKHNLYDFCLMNGYPVFDEKGKQIYINDPEKIKSGEQVEMKKAKNWEENVAKFKDFKPN